MESSGISDPFSIAPGDTKRVKGTIKGVSSRGERVFSSWVLAREYGFTDLDGTRPDWGSYARKKYGKYKVCDERFYSYWVPGVVELIFPDWF